MDMNFAPKQNPKQAQYQPLPQKSATGKVVAWVFVILLLLGASGTAFYFYKQWDNLKNNPQQASQNSNQILVDKISKLIVLPTDEQPTIATVTDLSQLKDQPFFDKAKIGDKVLVYQKAKLAYLYDPGQNIVVNVTSVTDATPTPDVSGTTTDIKQ